MSKKWKTVHIEENSSLQALGFIGLEVLEGGDCKIIKGNKISNIQKAIKRKKETEKALNKKTKKENKIQDNGSFKKKEQTLEVKGAMKKKTKRKFNIDKKVVEDSSGVATVENPVFNEKDNQFMSDMKAWQKHGLRVEILKALHEKGFFTPTKIQEKCIHGAVTSKNSDIVGAAETGSGKTYAYGIPIVQTIMDLKGTLDEETENNGLFALIVTPTRELAVQVKDHLTQICKYTTVKIALVVGGLAKEKQERLLKRKPEIVVGTPGRIWELFQEGNPHLLEIPHVRMLVVDEADRMLEKQHFAELGELLDRMNVQPDVKAKRRNFVFSATLTVTHEPPSYHAGKKKTKKILAKDKLKELLGQIGVKNQLVYDLSVKTYTPETLSEWKVNCQLVEKDYYLVYFLQNNPGRCIIFCNSIGCVRRLANLLTLMSLRPFPLHANMEQKQRLRNLEKFRDSKEAILLATDVAARGLDIPQVGHVIHYQVPRTAESYVHRSGRTARGSNVGASLLIIGVEEIKLYNKLLKTLNRDSGIEDLDVPPSELDAVKRLVHVARDIDQLSLAVKRTTSNEKWYEKAARDMDLILDDDQMPEKTSDHAMRKLNKDLNLKKMELKKLLNTTALPRGFSRKFPDLNVVKIPQKKRRVLP